MRESVVSRLKNIAQDSSKSKDGGISPVEEVPLSSARIEYLQKQDIELMQQARFLHARILLAIQANELSIELCRILYDGFLNMAALVQVKE